MTRPQLALVPPINEHGEIQDGCPQCRGKDGDILVLQREVTRLLRKVKSLEKDRDTERQSYPKRAQILEVFEHWVQAAGKNNSKLSADRFDAVKARLNEGYTVEQIKLAIDGAASHPYVVNAQRSPVGTGKKHDDPELVCRGGKRLEELAILGHAWRKTRA